MENEIIMQLKNLTKKFDDNIIIDGIDLEINQGERIAIIGSSGAGKTTLLRCMNQLAKQTGGEIIFDGKPLTRMQKNIGFVFQDLNLFANMNILKNITLAPISHNPKAKKEIVKLALKLLDQFGIPDKAKSYPHTLSGGQQQRVAIIRALINNPKIMLFDEPTSSLDPEMKYEILQVIKSLDKSIAIVLVTHELHFAKNFADKIIFLDNGKIIEQGTTAQIFTKPQTKQLQKFLSKVLA